MASEEVSWAVVMFAGPGTPQQACEGDRERESTMARPVWCHFTFVRGYGELVGSGGNVGKWDP